MVETNRKSNLRPQPNGLRRALDLGAGTGEATGQLVAHGMDVAHSGLRPAWIHLLTWFLLAIFALCVVAFGPSIFPNLDWIMTPPEQQ